MRHLLLGFLLVAAFASSSCAPTMMSATLQLRGAPPPPMIEFRGEPRFTYLSDFGVSVIADDDFGYDLFGCDGSYYLFSGGYWYRGETAQGPFVAIEARRVPRRVFDVDDRQYRWRRHPDGWRRANGRDRDDRGDRDDRDDRDEGGGH